MPHWLRPHLVACLRNNLRRKPLDRGCTVSLDFFDRYCHLYILCLLCHLFLVAAKNSSRWHSVLMLLSLSSATNLSLFFGFCTACMLAYRCLQMEWWAAVTVVAIPSQPALLIWPCISAATPSVLSPQASRVCTADTLMIASCLFWSENWLLAYFLPPPSPIASFATMGFFCHSNTSPA